MAAQSLADPTADLYWPGWLWWKLPQLCLLHQIPPQDNHNLQWKLAKTASSNSNPSTIDRVRKSEVLQKCHGWKWPQLCLLHQIPPQDNHNLQSRLDGCTAKPAPIQIPQLLIESEKFYKNAMGGGNDYNYVYWSRAIISAKKASPNLNPYW